MRHKLRALLQDIIGDEKHGIEFEIRRHAPQEFSARGEYSSNIAFALAAKIGREPKNTPTEIAGELEQQLALKWSLQDRPPGFSCSAAKGFLNFRMNDETLQNGISRALDEGEQYGAAATLAGQRINVEFVSADPTGPLHLIHGRIAVGGDALCRLLSFQGADVTREYFLNDVEGSSKMRLLGESVSGLYNRQFGHNHEMPEGALEDDFLRSVATRMASREGNGFLLRPEGERISAFAHEAREAAVENQKQTLGALNVPFDVWTSESSLGGDGRVAAIVARLQSAGHVEEKSGALWLRSSKFGDETDRPLRRANGEYTYLASDIAYHSYRFERGFDALINIWTAQHEQYLQRTHAALQAANYSPEKLEVVVCETTRLTRDGAPVESDREYLLNDALEEVEAETLRFLLLLVGWNEPAQVEIEDARRDDESNPAYAARLLPSRLSTLVRQAQAADAPADVNWSEAERQLARLVAMWPDEVATAARERRPQRVARFVLEMAEATKQLLANTRAQDVLSVEVLRAGHTVAGNALRVLGMKPREKF